MMVCALIWWFVWQSAAGGASGAPGGSVNESDEFCIKSDEFCIKSDEFCIKNDEFCTRNLRCNTYFYQPAATSAAGQSARNEASFQSKTKITPLKKDDFEDSSVEKGWFLRFFRWKRMILKILPLKNDDVCATAGQQQQPCDMAPLRHFASQNTQVSWHTQPDDVFRWAFTEKCVFFLFHSAPGGASVRIPPVWFVFTILNYKFHDF